MTKENCAGGSESRSCFWSYSHFRISLLALFWSSLEMLFSRLALDLKGLTGLEGSSLIEELIPAIESISTNSFSNTSIRAYPNPGMMLVRACCFAPKVGFRPVVTEIARLAASFNLRSIMPEEDWKAAASSSFWDGVPPKRAPKEGLKALPMTPYDPTILPPLAMADCEGNEGRNSFSQ